MAVWKSNGCTSACCYKPTIEGEAGLCWITRIGNCTSGSGAAVGNSAATLTIKKYS
jgi:hypothetical protein